MIVALASSSLWMRAYYNSPNLSNVSLSYLLSSKHLFKVCAFSSLISLSLTTTYTTRHARSSADSRTITVSSSIALNALPTPSAMLVWSRTMPKHLSDYDKHSGALATCFQAHVLSIPSRINDLSLSSSYNSFIISSTHCKPASLVSGL